MDNETLEALRGSIAKWEGIVAGTIRDRGADNCPLCAKFLDENSYRTRADCMGCPVMENTGEQYCKGTPYRDEPSVLAPDYDNAITKWAQAELDFLKSLLPVERQVVT